MNFEQEYKVTPAWLSKKINRRSLLKSAAGASAIAAMPTMAFNLSTLHVEKLKQALTTSPWSTLNSVLEHLLPSSESGPGAKEIQAVQYLYLLVHQQPTAQDEIDFVYKGVGWLNGYTQKRYQKPFEQIETIEKEKTLTAISQSSAGENWLNMLILNIYEAMLSPPAYGGNPDGIGWQWLKHQAGFPLPQTGQRYFELPQRSAKKNQETLSVKMIESQPNHLSKLKDKSA